MQPRVFPRFAETRPEMGLRKLAAAAGRRFIAGIVMYDGETSVGFGDRMYAVPIRALWES